MVSSCFFFSSRRRHTRSKRDWSSDVCSSDLAASAAPAEGQRELRTLRAEALTEVGLRPDPVDLALVMSGDLDRSEERRVGKECRSRWSQYHEKKKYTYRLKREQR